MKNLAVLISNAGIQTTNNHLQTSGGRVLAVTALADTLKLAQTRAYIAIKCISFAGAQYRSDIGNKALAAF